MNSLPMYASSEQEPGPSSAVKRLRGARRALGVRGALREMSKAAQVNGRGGFRAG
jgi:hypothetical protein